MCPDEFRRIARSQDDQRNQDGWEEQNMDDTANYLNRRQKATGIDIHSHRNEKDRPNNESRVPGPGNILRVVLNDQSLDLGADQVGGGGHVCPPGEHLPC